MVIEAAIVGLGRWGRNLVASVQGRSGKLRFVQAVVREPRKASEFAEKHGLSLSTDFERVLHDDSIQAIVLATPHSLHAQQIVAAAAAGKPVFCEKPLALTRADAERAVSACEHAGVALALGHDKRFWPSMRALACIVAGGELGELLHIEGHFSNESTGRYYAGWRASDDDAPGGGLTAMGVHLLDAFVGLVGPVRCVHAHVVTHPPSPAPVDTLTLFLEFQNCVSGVVCSVRTSPSYWRVHVFGKDGSAEAVGPSALTVRRTDAPPEHRSFEPVDSLRAELEAFADAVSGSAPYPITLQQMIDGVAALGASIESFGTGREVRVPA
ncbi:MAG: Gfo/Idh/MocA family protein [Burkholderiales bacterium]